MTKLKQLVIHVPQEWRDALKAHVGWGNMSSWMRTAAEKLYREQTGEALPGDVRPLGVGKDQRPTGWRGIMYRDRYQFISVWHPEEREFVVYKQHEFNRETFGFSVAGTMRGEQPLPFEMVVYAPADWSPEQMGQEPLYQLRERPDEFFDRG